MTRSSPFIQDRAIPLYPGLAMFLDYLPGIDPDSARKPRRRKKKKTGETFETSGVSMTTRGMVRALVITQLDHRLQDNPADRDLLIRDGKRWYARSYESWHYWDFQVFMSRPTMTRAFQDLAAAGYVLRRNQTDFVRADMSLAEKNAIKKVMHVYHGLAWGIDYERLEAAMASNPRVRAYYATRETIAVKTTSDQADQTSQGADQADQAPRISLIRLSDQADQAGAIRLITGSDQPDQRSAESDQNPDQRSAESSAAAPAPPAEQDSRTGLSLKKQAPPIPSPAAPASEPDKKPYDELDNVQKNLYLTLTSPWLRVDPHDAVEFAKNSPGEQILGWIEYIKRRNAGGLRDLAEIRNPGGFLSQMLRRGPENLAPEPKKSQTAAEKFLGGELADHINH